MNPITGLPDDPVGGATPMNGGPTPMNGGPTLIIGLGDLGAAVITAIQVRVRQRYGDLPGLGCLVIASELVGGVAPDRYGDPDAIEDALRATLLAALATPRTSWGAADRGRRLSADGGEAAQPQIHLVTAADDAFGGQRFVDLAHLARRVVERHLHSPALVTGWLSLPDTLILQDPELALAAARTAVIAVDRARTCAGADGPSVFAVTVPPDLATGEGDSTGGGDPTGGSDPTGDCDLTGVDGDSQGLPLFDGGCFLFDALDAAGRRVGDAAERAQLIAEALLQRALVMSATGDPVDAGDWPVAAGGCEFRSIGLAAWVLPRAEAAEAVARRLAGTIIAAWLADVGGETSDRVAPESAAAGAAGQSTFQARAAAEGLDPESAGPALLQQAQARIGVLDPHAIPSLPLLTWSSAPFARAAIEAEANDYLERLADQRASLDLAAEALGDAMGAAVTDGVHSVLLRLDPGDLAQAARHVHEAAATLNRWSTELAAAADALWATLGPADLEIERLEREIDHLVAAYRPDPDAPKHLSIAHLRRLLHRWRTRRMLSHHLAALHALWRRKVDGVHGMMWRDLQRQACGRALEHVAVQGRALADLRDVIEIARLCLDALPDDPPDLRMPNPTAPAGAVLEFQQTSSHPLVQSYPLEQSILTDDLLDEIADAVIEPAAVLLTEIDAAGSRLVEWLDTVPAPADVAAACLGFARGKVSAVRAAEIDALLWHSFGAVGGREAADLLNRLCGSTLPCLAWDALRLTESERSRVRVFTTLVTARGGASPLLAGEGEPPWQTVAASGDPTRITAVVEVRGLPRAALIGLDPWDAREAGPATSGRAKDCSTVEQPSIPDPKET